VELLEELQVPHVDALPHFLTYSQYPLYNMTQAGHLSVRGHRVVAQILGFHAMRQRRAAEQPRLLLQQHQ
jgi:hypothetical protein